MASNYQSMMRSLIDATIDHDAVVRDAALTALTTIGLHAPPLLLECVHAHLASNTKVLWLSQDHFLIFPFRCARTSAVQYFE